MLGSASAPSKAAPYLPFAAPFRLAMGLMPLAEADWLEPDADLAAHLAEKRHLLGTRRDEVFAALPEAEAPARELLRLLAQHLPAHHPDRYRGDGARLENKVTGEAWDIAAPTLHPLDLCGRLVQEDFCLVAAHILVGATLAAPARWRLADKIGRPLIALHEPVPGYDATLARAVDRFFTHLKPDRLAWRLNWGVLDHPARFQPEAVHGSVSVTAANAGENLWLRVERQTFRKLPETGAVVFAIRTHITRLDHALAGAPDAAAALAEAIRTMPEAMRQYKQIAPVASALLGWLAARIRA